MRPIEGIHFRKLYLYILKYHNKQDHLCATRCANHWSRARQAWPGSIGR